MGVSGWLLGVAARRPGALLVPVPGATAARLAVERELRRRGWPPARSPAEASLLVVCGTPGPRLATAAEALWEALPSPRARAEVAPGGDPATALDDAVARLADLAGQRAGARRAAPTVPDLAMADRAADRDGLMLDRLHVPLGPVLPDWPAGLVLRLALQGDVVQEAGAEVLGGATTGERFWEEPGRAAAGSLDSVGRLLGVAGWDGAALAARRLRDDLLDGHPPGRVAPAFERLSRRVRRSRLLRWMTRGLGALSPEAAVAAGIPGAAGDVADRCGRWLDATAAALAGEEPAPRHDPAALLAALPELVTGAELAATRLVVASLDPDTGALATVAEPVRA